MTDRPNYNEPPSDCSVCGRLFDFRLKQKKLYPDWFNAPVPDFAGAEPKVIIVGLAPGLRGGNRTGIPFRGDFSGRVLSRALVGAGLARYRDPQDPDAGIWPDHVCISNIVRCVPPQNKVRMDEVKACRGYFLEMLSAYAAVPVIFAVGRQAHEAVIRSFGLSGRDYPFCHGSRVTLPDGRWLFSSYHCSRYNIQTRRLSEDAFCAEIRAAATLAFDACCKSQSSG